MVPARLGGRSPGTLSLVRGFWGLAVAGAGLEGASSLSAGEPRLLKDIETAPAGSVPGWIVTAGNRGFFSADDLEHNRELWVSDGTEEGTRLFSDLVPGCGSSVPSDLGCKAYAGC